MRKTVLIGAITSILALSLAAAVYAVGGHPWKENPTLLRLKSNGETVAELRILKDTKAKVEMNGEIKIKQVAGMHRATLTNSKGEPQIRLVVEGAPPVEIKADQIDFEMAAPEQPPK